ILPLLGFPSDISAEKIRETKPVLFLAILTVASASILPSLESQLVMELREQIARQLFILGKRSMELIQAALLYSQYYMRPSESQNFAFTQYVSAAVTMCCDLAIGRKARLASEADIGARKDAARTWLACWYASST